MIRLFSSKWTGVALGYRSSVKLKIPPGRESSYNVLILGFDSTSKKSQSYKVLTEELHATVLNGYNIVGDGTPASLFPILTGETELEVLGENKTLTNKGYIDTAPFIFHKLKEHGYDSEPSCISKSHPHLFMFCYCNN